MVQSLGMASLAEVSHSKRIQSDLADGSGKLREHTFDRLLREQVVDDHVGERSGGGDRSSVGLRDSVQEVGIDPRSLRITGVVAECGSWRSKYSLW